MASLVIRWAALLAVCILIFSFSSANAEVSSEQSGTVVEVVEEVVFDDFKGLDAAQAAEAEDILTIAVRKLAHFSVYALLGFTAFFAFVQMGSSGTRYIFAVIFSLAYACTDEFHQTFVDGRAGMLMDILIDTAGAMTGALIPMAVVAKREKRHRKLQKILQKEKREKLLEEIRAEQEAENDK